jgi:hypothetical protein
MADPLVHAAARGDACADNSRQVERVALGWVFAIAVLAFAC